MKRASMLATAVVFSLAAVVSAVAQDETIVLEMEEFTCKDMLLRSGFERDFTVAYMHGFMSGKMDETQLDVAKLTAATDAVLEYCIENPDATILSAFEQARG